MQQSEDIKELATAIGKMQALGLVAVKATENRHLNTRYANLVDIWELIRPKLAENNLIVTQSLGKVRFENSAFCLEVETQVTHTPTGQWMRTTGDVLIPEAILNKSGGSVINLAQREGSGHTYGRRYSLCALLGIATGDDDDAHRAAQQADSGGVESVGEETWQDLFKSGAWRYKEAPSDPDWRKLSELPVGELRAAIKLNIDNGGGNAAVTASQATMLFAAAKARGHSVETALVAVKWKGCADLLDMTTSEMHLAYNSIITLPKVDAKQEGEE